jgi:hypothetical protein
MLCKEQVQCSAIAQGTVLTGCGNAAPHVMISTKSAGLATLLIHAMLSPAQSCADTRRPTYRVLRRQACRVPQSVSVERGPLLPVRRQRDPGGALRALRCLLKRALAPSAGSRMDDTQCSNDIIQIT